jgi:hypothetical protein
MATCVDHGVVSEALLETRPFSLLAVVAVPGPEADAG